MTKISDETKGDGSIKLLSTPMDKCVEAIAKALTLFAQGSLKPEQMKTLGVGFLNSMGYQFMMKAVHKAQDQLGLKDDFCDAAQGHFSAFDKLVNSNTQNPSECAAAISHYTSHFMTSGVEKYGPEAFGLQALPGMPTGPSPTPQSPATAKPFLKVVSSKPDPAEQVFKPVDLSKVTPKGDKPN